MKKSLSTLRSLCFLFSLALLSTQCTEVPVVINNDGGPDGPDVSELTTQPRIVFMEEFTGVACVQCPEGSEFLETLLDIHQDRLVAVSIHGGFFSRLFTESVRDLKVDDGVALINLFTEPEGYPASIINRKQFPESQSFHVFREDWAGTVINELEGDPLIAIGLEAKATGDNSQVTVSLELLPRDVLPENLRLTIGIAESNIVEAQKTPTGTVVDYVHKHVLRDVFTPFNGQPIEENLIQGTVTPLEYTYDIPEGVVLENAEIFAAVHIINPTLDVYQANKTKITQ